MFKSSFLSRSGYGGSHTVSENAACEMSILGVPFGDLRLDESYFLQDNQCTLAFPKYLLHGLNDMQGRQLAGTNMSKLVTSGACHLEIL